MINPRIKKFYYEKSRKLLKSKFGYSNVMSIPRILKVVINISTKDIINNKMISNTIYDDLFTITGQKPFFTRAKKSIATFKLRKGNILGVKTTLRKNTMYEFIDKLINIALPRVRDFKGINCLYFDGKGNISIGVKEYLVFPEIDFDKIIKVRGLNISIVTSAKTDVEAKFLLETLNIPFEKKKKND